MTPNDREAANGALRRLQVGDRAAAKIVFELLWPMMLSFSRRALRDASKAQDAAQDALMKLFEQAADFRQGGDAMAWALEITAWECRTELRREHRSAHAPADDPAEAPLAADALLERQELVRSMGETLGQLSAPDRLLIESILKDAYPSKPDAAMRKRRQRALERLRRIWSVLYGS